MHILTADKSLLGFRLIKRSLRNVHACAAVIHFNQNGKVIEYANYAKGGATMTSTAELKITPSDAGSAEARATIFAAENTGEGEIL